MNQADILARRQRLIILTQPCNCTRPKSSRYAFCRLCWRSLTDSHRRAIGDNWNDYVRFLAVYRSAIEYLRALRAKPAKSSAAAAGQ